MSRHTTRLPKTQPVNPGYRKGLPPYNAIFPNYNLSNAFSKFTATRSSALTSCPKYGFLPPSTILSSAFIGLRMFPGNNKLSDRRRKCLVGARTAGLIRMTSSSSSLLSALEGWASKACVASIRFSARRCCLTWKVVRLCGLAMATSPNVKGLTAPDRMGLELRPPMGLTAPLRPAGLILLYVNGLTAPLLTLGKLITRLPILKSGLS